MKEIIKDPQEQREIDKNDATKAFDNVENSTAININNAGDKKSRNYKNGNDDANGPDWNRESTSVEGDTTANSGTFK